jgi:hypothetical protein
MNIAWGGDVVLEYRRHHKTATSSSDTSTSMIAAAGPTLAGGGRFQLLVSSLAIGAALLALTSAPAQPSAAPAPNSGRRFEGPDGGIQCPRHDCMNV